MDLSLLKQIYAAHSLSGKEGKRRKVVRDYVRKNIPDTKMFTDPAGNLFITRGQSDTYPCVCAHLDMVCQTRSRDFNTYETDELLFGFSLKNRRQESAGMDDGNGIFAAIVMLERFPVMKVALFTREEVGAQGASECDMSFFADCRFIIEPDRKGGTDIITDNGWITLCSDEFLKATGYEAFGYKPTSGLLTDVFCLKERGLGISCINLSIGYVNHHHDSEVTVKADLIRGIEFLAHVIETCTDVYPHESDDYQGYGFYGSAKDMDLYDWIEDYLLYYPDATDAEVVSEFSDCTRLSADEIAGIAQEIRDIYDIGNPEEGQI
ncbi:MAG: hypothetical protein II693_02245 [Bacteroidales bacterium]|nr:hypothetical protein [Bacteroidales bacterium]